MVSDASEPGEGELKIFKHMKSIAERDPAASMVAAGSDSDLILLGLCVPSSNLHVMQSTSEGLGRDECLFVRVSDLRLKLERLSIQQCECSNQCRL